MYKSFSKQFDKNKMTNTKRIITILLLIGAYLTAQAQVTIGLSEAPQKYAILQVMDQIPNSDNETALTGGIVLPRVNLTKRYELLPFVAASRVGVNDTQYETIEKPMHTGLIVYNVKEVVTEDLFVGLNQWDGEKWNGLQSHTPIAQASISNCDSISFAGEYQNKVALTYENVMKIPLRVTKPGSYTITATIKQAGAPTKDNNYYFIASGTFMSTGYYYLTIPGVGTPLQFTPDSNLGDLVTIAINGNPLLTPGCEKHIIVKDSSIKPLYTMNCSGIKVDGVYQINTELGEDNTITLYLTVDPSALGATYTIKTNTVDGISFSATAKLNNISEKVVLVGSGKPTSMTPKVMTITSNSTLDVSTCSVTIPIAYTSKKILGIGYYNNLTGYHINSSASLKVMNTPANFGLLPTSKVKVPVPFTYSYIQGPEGNNKIDGSGNIDETYLQQELDKKPDIVVVGFFLNYSPLTIDKLVKYLNQGGVLILFSEYSYPPNVSFLFKTLFADQNINGPTTGVNGGGSLYRIASVNDEITNGPFGDVRGLLWGDDTSASLNMIGLPATDLTTYSTATAVGGTSQAGITMFKHNKLNLFWVGDGGFVSNNNTATDIYGGGLSSGTSYPFAINASGQPIGRQNYQAAGNTVYNSVIFSNVMAWAMKQAQFSGINTAK